MSGTKLWITGDCQERLPEKGVSELCEIERKEGDLGLKR